jgi:hypothetical protein
MAERLAVDFLLLLSDKGNDEDLLGLARRPEFNPNLGQDDFCFHESIYRLLTVIQNIKLSERTQYTPFTAAACSGRKGLITELLERGGKFPPKKKHVMQRVLLGILQNRDFYLIPIMIEHGVDVRDLVSRLEHAYAKLGVDVVKYMEKELKIRCECNQSYNVPRDVAVYIWFRQPLRYRNTHRPLLATFFPNNDTAIQDIEAIWVLLLATKKKGNEVRKIANVTDIVRCIFGFL